MRTLQEKYNGIQEGKFSKDQFLIEARKELPNLVTRFNGYDDAVQILKNRGMIQEAVKENAVKAHMEKLIQAAKTGDKKKESILAGFAGAGIKYKVTNAEPNIIKYWNDEQGLKGEIELKETVKEASYKTSSNSKEAQHLKKGDIIGSGDEVVSVSAGAKTPAGKVEVTLKTKSGSTKTSTWGKTTKVGVKPKETVNETSNILRGFLKWIRSVVQHEGTEEQVNQYIDSVESNMRKPNGHEKYIGWEESDYITDFNRTLTEAGEDGDKRYYHLIKGSKKHGEDRQEYVNCFSTMKNAQYVQDQKSENDPENYYQIVISRSQDQPSLNEAKQPKATKKGLTDYRYKPTNEMDKYPYEQILRGIRVELETLGVQGTPTAEEYAKALAKVSKNLAKDPIFYTNQIAGINKKVDLHDKITPVDQKQLFKTSVAEKSKAEGNTDTFNGLKKAELKEGFKRIIKKVLSEGMESIGDREDWRHDKNDPLHDYMKSKEPKTDDVENYKKEEERGHIDEAPATNDPKIQKLVDGINQLISQAKDSDGDPIGVVEPGSSWEEPEMYSPIEYRNGALKITTKSPYKSIPSTDTISAGNMQLDGIPTLRLIMRMYKKAVKKTGQEAYPEKQDLDETATDITGFPKWRELSQDEKDHISKSVKDSGDRDQAEYEKARDERLKAQSARLEKYIRGEKVDEDYFSNYGSEEPTAEESETKADVTYSRGADHFLNGAKDIAERLRQQAIRQGQLTHQDEEDFPPYESDGERVDEATGSESYRGYVIELNSYNQAGHPNTTYSFYNEDDSDELMGTGRSIEDCKEQIDYLIDDRLDEAMDNTQDLVIFSIDSEDLDQILHTNFGRNLAYQDDRGDSLYTLPQEDFDRFMDYITSLVGDQAEDQVSIHSGSDHWGNDADDTSHPRGYEEASDEESFDDLFETVSLKDLL